MERIANCAYTTRRTAELHSTAPDSALHYLTAIPAKNGRVFQEVLALILPVWLSKALWRSAVLVTRISMQVTMAAQNHRTLGVLPAVTLTRSRG